jgi:serine/threonine-protein kinase
MGEVYRAHDHSTGRDVALKVLPEAVASDPERLARFQREAKALGVLNHPNIAAIYGVEDRGARPAIVMELVAGEDLSVRIARGRVPVAEALAIARQIADAVSAAHDAGIVHRDLKPANVKVRDDGVVKVLDFGLAKASDPAAAGSATDSPTLTARATALGMILGTAAYMAPEQARGKAVDKRADIWAFGVVLFEMLAGRRAFAGDDISDVLAAVLKTEPDWGALPDVPAPVRRLIQRCLEKDPRQRLRDLAEGVRQLDDAPLTAPRAVQPFWRRALPVAAAVLVTALATIAIDRARTPAAVPAKPTRFLLPGSVDAPFAATAQYPDLAIAPDGSFVVYSVFARGASSPSLWLHPLDQFAPSPLRGGESALAPFVSPDSQWIGYVDAISPSQLKKVQAGGGTPTTVGAVPPFTTGATWLRNGVIVTGTANRGLYKIGDGGGEPVEVTVLDDKTNERAHRAPAAVPDTDVVLFCTFSGANPKLAAVNVATGKVARFEIQGYSPRYIESGHMVFVSADGVLRAVAFDPDRLEVRGDPAPVLEGIAIKATGAANFTVARNGTLVYAQGTGVRAARRIVWVDRLGKETATSTPTHTYFYARVSPDGGKLALDVREKEADLWIWDTRGTMRRLTQNPGADQYGLWTPPDGARIVFQSDLRQKAGLYIARADAIGDPELVLEHPGAFPNAITPDGKSIIFRASTTATRNDLFLVPIAGPDRTVTTLVQTPHEEYNAALSPDGKWMAFESDSSGRQEVYVRPFPDVNTGQDVISTAGGSEPAWAPRGNPEVVYLGADNWMYSVAVTVSPGGKISFAAPVRLFDASGYFFGGLGRNYDLSPDGKRFAMVKIDDAKGATPDPLRVVLHWADELKRPR